jgi:histidinol-phosphatase
MTELELAHLLADAADDLALAAYRTDAFSIETKPDGTVVTNVDREVESTLVRLLAEHRPGEGVLGEELGAGGPESPRWLIDPIDGTSSFATGELEWATLVARVVDEKLDLGVVTSPALEHRWWATAGGGAWAVTPGTGDRPSRLRVSPMDVVDGARVAAWPPPRRLRPDHARRVEQFHRGAMASGADLRGVDIKPTRETGFPAAPVMVAAGALDASFILGCGPWDLAALVILVEEAGGRFTDPEGGRRLDRFGGLFSNGLIHDEVNAWVGPDVLRAVDD